MAPAEAGHLSVVHILLAAGADVEIRAKKGGYLMDGRALIIAAEIGAMCILNALLAHGVEVNAAGIWGMNALHRAAATDKVGAIEALIEAGADIELKDPNGLTPFCHAAMESSCGAMRALLQHGANTDVRGIQETDTLIIGRGDTCLHLACRQKRYGLGIAVDFLLRAGADETAVNDHGDTPLELAESLPLVGAWSPREETERARQLLTRAPNDRAWRRRC